MYFNCIKKTLIRLRYTRHDGPSDLLEKVVEDKGEEKADVVIWMRTGVGTRKVTGRGQGYREGQSCECR